MNTTENWLWDQARKAAAEAFRIQCRDIYAAVYLYYRRGELRAVTDRPGKGWELGTAERISPMLTVEQNTAKLHAIARKLPCLPEEEQCRKEEDSQKARSFEGENIFGTQSELCANYARHLAAEIAKGRKRGTP